MLDTAAHIEITEQFIDENPSQITITRETIVGDGAGGKISSGTTTLGAQKMRLVGIEPRRGQTLIMLVTRDGENVTANSTIIAMPDANIQNQDQFTIDGDLTNVYEVLHVESHPEWRIRAEVYLHRG
jgi:hypothetical protein